MTLWDTIRPFAFLLSEMGASGGLGGKEREDLPYLLNRTSLIPVWGIRAKKEDYLIGNGNNRPFICK